MRPTPWKKPPTIIKTESGISSRGSLSTFGKRCGAYVNDMEEEADVAAATREDSEAYGADGEQALLSGFIKSWNSGKGFGFITCDGIDGDVFFSKAELPAEAREVHGNVLEGREVNLDISSGPDGRARATTVQLCYAEDKPLIGVIKSYSDRHRYGFVTSSTLNEDAQFHATDLPPGLSAMGPSLKGNYVTFEVQRLEDGKVRVSKMQLQGGAGGAGGGGAPGRATMLPPPPPAFQSVFAAPPARIPPWHQPRRPPQRSSTAADGELMTGVVKSYSDRHGYGFITTPGEVVDVKFSKADLLSPSVSQGTSVSFVSAVTPDGRLQAREVAIDESGAKRATPSSGFGGEFDRPIKQPRVGGGCGTPWGSVAAGRHQQYSPVDGERLTGVVRSYIPNSGFGFITCDDMPGDIYFGKAVMPPDMHLMELSGRMVTFELTYASDGKLRSRSVELA